MREPARLPAAHQLPRTGRVGDFVSFRRSALVRAKRRRRQGQKKLRSSNRLALSLSRPRRPTGLQGCRAAQGSRVLGCARCLPGSRSVRCISGHWCRTSCAPSCVTYRQYGAVPYRFTANGVEQNPCPLPESPAPGFRVAAPAQHSQHPRRLLVRPWLAPPLLLRLACPSSTTERQPGPGVGPVQPSPVHSVHSGAAAGVSSFLRPPSCCCPAQRGDRPPRPPDAPHLHTPNHNLQLSTPDERATDRRTHCCCEQPTTTQQHHGPQRWRPVISARCIDSPAAVIRDISTLVPRRPPTLRVLDRPCTSISSPRPPTHPIHPPPVRPTPRLPLPPPPSPLSPI